MRGRVGHAWQGGAYVVGEGSVHGRDDHCSGLFTSYWNALLFVAICRDITKPGKRKLVLDYSP